MAYEDAILCCVEAKDLGRFTTLVEELESTSNFQDKLTLVDCLDKLVVTGSATTLDYCLEILGFLEHLRELQSKTVH